MIKLSVKGKLGDTIRKRLDRGIEEMSEDLKDYLKDETPVDTGYAKSRWRLRRDSISNDADYIDVLEDGWSKQAPKGMLKPALNKLRRKWRNKRI